MHWSLFTEQTLRDFLVVKNTQRFRPAFFEAWQGKKKVCHGPRIFVYKRFQSVRFRFASHDVLCGQSKYRCLVSVDRPQRRGTGIFVPPLPANEYALTRGTFLLSSNASKNAPLPMELFRPDPLSCAHRFWWGAILFCRFVLVLTRLDNVWAWEGSRPRRPRYRFGQ